jgi:hypothetical protein
MVTFNIGVTMSKWTSTVSVLGNNQNDTKFIKKIALDGNGVIQRDEGKKPTPDARRRSQKVGGAIHRSHDLGCKHDQGFSTSGPFL